MSIWMDQAEVSISLVGTVLNLLGLAVPLVLSAATSSVVKQRFFTFWTLNYLLSLVMVGSEGFMRSLGYPPLAVIASTTIFTASSISLFLTAELIVTDRIHQRRAVGIGAVATAWTVILVACSQPLTIVLLPLLLLNIAGHVQVGRALFWFHRCSPGIRATRMLGAWVIFTGLWVLAYPFLAARSMVWIGSMVAALNHFIVGIGMIVFSQEIIARQLREQNASLVELDRLKTNFLATVSHELRTPLTSIKASLWLLEQQRLGGLNEGQRELVSGLQMNTEALIGQITGLLEFSKLDLDMRTYHMETSGLADLLRDEMERFASLFETKGIELKLELAGETASVFDREALQQVIANLLSNAVKFTPKGGRVTLRLREVEGQAMIEVQDTGPGIPPEQHLKIFDKFYQVDSSSTRKFGGTGLGLAICKAIVEQGHQGRIWVESQLGQGSTFVVALPLAER